MTPPGYAKDVSQLSPLSTPVLTLLQYVQKSARPLIPASVPMHETSYSDVHDPEASHHAHRPSLSATTAQSHTSQLNPRNVNGLAGPSYEDLLKRDGTETQDRDLHAGILDAIPKPVLPSGPTHPQRSPNSSTTVAPQSPTLKLKKPKAEPSSSKQDGKVSERELALDQQGVHRRPPTTAVLQPIHRFCTPDEIVKPYRAHHCRVCGTVSAPFFSLIVDKLIIGPVCFEIRSPLPLDRSMCGCSKSQSSLSFSQSRSFLKSDNHIVLPELLSSYRSIHCLHLLHTTGLHHQGDEQL